MTHEKYFNYFFKLLVKNNNKTQEQLFIELERWHFKQCGKSKCKDYDSFRSLKSQWYKANRT
jgi:hypothetical protein